MKKHILFISTILTFWASPTWADPAQECNTLFLQKNYVQAFPFCKKAAQQGYAFAQSQLGFMYDIGHGVAQDYKEAVKWYRKAALQGDAFAQYGLGFMYEYGEGVAQDYIQAHMWYNLAGVSIKSAAENRDSLARKMTPSQIEKAQDLARKFKKK